MHIISEHRVIPVISLENAADAIPLAEALLEGGINVMEITLRTEDALASITNVREKIPEMCLGAGTITNLNQVKDIFAAGVDFFVSPGNSKKLNDALQSFANCQHFPLTEKWLPGAVTPSEILTLNELGYNTLKFFPADAMNGPRALRQYASVFPQMQFCATGGITLQNMNDYLELPNVLSIGGSWIAPKEAISEKSWRTITKNARTAIAQAYHNT